MISRLVRPCLAVLLAAVAFDARAQAPAVVPPPSGAAPAAARPADDPLVTFRLPDGDIDDALSALEQFTGRTILRPAALPTAPHGYNLRLVDVPRSQAVLAIETVLALNGIGVAPQGDRFFVVTQLQQIRGQAPELITGSSLDQPPSGKIAAKVFQLQFLQTQFVQGFLQQTLNQLAGSQVIPLQNSNAFMIIDSVANIQRVETLLQQVDKPATAGLQPKFYQLRNGAKASDLVQKIRSMLPQTVQQQLGTSTTYQADDRTNQIVVMTDPAQYPIFDELIEKLDIRADPNTRNDVIYLKHAKASELVSVLTNIISKQTAAIQRNSQSTRPGQGIISAPTINQPIVPGGPVQPQPAPQVIAASSAGVEPGTSEFSSIMTVVNDDRSNSIVVSGTADDIRLLRELVDKLDIILAQVRIEVVIAEVSLDDSHTSGISQLGLNVQGDRLIGFNGAVPGLTLSGATDANGTASGFATTSRIGGPGSLGRSLDLAGIISLGITPRKNNTTVLSVPSITTTHAKPATFISSEIRPITTGTTTTPVGTTNSNNGFATQEQVTQQDIGITLNVTPLIGNDGTVQLDIDQDVRDVAGTVTINGNEQPIISHRQTKSFITARSGEIKVLGGMQRTKDSRQTNRLGPIPFIGDLFGSRAKNVTRTELIFFLRPYVLDNSAADNQPMLDRIKELPSKDVPQKEDIMKLADPHYVPPKQTILDKILPH
jgi:general secretion pathway protein D